MARARKAAIDQNVGSLRTSFCAAVVWLEVIVILASLAACRGWAKLAEGIVAGLRVSVGLIAVPVSEGIAISAG